MGKRFAVANAVVREEKGTLASDVAVGDAWLQLGHLPGQELPNSDATLTNVAVCCVLLGLAIQVPGILALNTSRFDGRVIKGLCPPKPASFMQYKGES